MESFYATATDGTNIYVAGTTTSFGPAGSNAEILKYDANGTLVWNVTWGGDGSDSAQDIVYYAGSLYVAGDTSSYGSGQRDAAILNLDSNGSVKWLRTYGGSSDDYASALLITNNSIYTTGATGSFANGGTDTFLTRYSLNGTEFWNKTSGGPGLEDSVSIATDGDCVYIGGDIIAYGSADYDALIMKYMQNGTLAWEREWGATGSDGIYGLAMNGTDIYAVGYTNSTGAGSYDGFLLEYSSDGSIVFFRTAGGTGYDDFRGICIDSSGIYIAGETNSIGSGGMDAWFLKTNFSGGEGIVDELAGVLPIFTCVATLSICLIRYRKKPRV
jgi:hypothetical protein